MLSIRRIGVIGRTYRHINRYRRILRVLFKFGFGDLVDSLKLETYIEIGLKMVSRKQRENLEKLSRPQRIRMALEDLGPTFIKLGQILSTRPDLVPMEFIDELSKLQDNVAPFPFEDVKSIIEEEIGTSIDEVFEVLYEEPLAAASIGQVHKGVLKDGKNVVIKVQRPDIRRIIEVDLEIIHHISSLMEKHIQEFDLQKPTLVVEEFARKLENEINYSAEATNIERFATQFKGDENIFAPDVYKEYSTSKVLMMEYFEGIKISDIKSLEEKKYNLKEIALIVANSILKQVFNYGFFHADPHPGNVYITEGKKVCYLDFGIMGRIGREEREEFSELIANIVKRNEKKVVKSVLKLTHTTEDPSIPDLERHIGDFIDKYLYLPLKEIRVGSMLYELIDILTRHSLRLKPHLFLMMKTVVTMEGLGLKLDPGFETIKVAEPFVKELEIGKLDPARSAREFYETSKELAFIMKELPGDLHSLLNKAKEGRIKMEFEHKGLDEMLHTHDRLSNRIAFAILVASLVIGSSLIMLSGLPPIWLGIPVIGLAGFVVSGFMSIWLLLTILRRGKM